MNIEKTKRECYKIAEKYYPLDSPSSFAIFHNLFKEYLTKDKRLLNAGCGTGKENIIYKELLELAVGVDMDQDSLKQNNLYNLLINTNLERLPFQDESFDIIISQDVLEHLENPHTVFKEFARVLKKGGSLVFLTPNVYGYVSIFSMLTPTKFHVFYNGLRGQKESDIFPTYYRANSKRALKKLCEETGFNKKELITFQKWPSYLILSKTLFRIGIFYERLINRFRIFSSFRSVIIASFEKL
jgi:ubiquinone/menaquinone biosynthesis C-methylase UbiE